MKLIAPSILSADFSKLGEEVKAVEAAGADWLHVDVMDGHFVPNITIGPLVVEAVKRATELPLDVHLMIEDPNQYLEDFARAGSALLTVQVEACVHLHRTIQAIKALDVKAGVALNPGTPLSAIEWILEDVDVVVVMSVNPGFGGQAFIPQTLQKLRDLKSMTLSRNPNVLIEVDGGVNQKTIRSVAEAGADVFVAGSAIFGSSDYGKTITKLRSVIEEIEMG
ncbi:MAG: ribulose-phosphate 3-epimerase [Desulfobacterales bacterium C00003060]|nr:MAG: ribulose-phosphate 3-epimerase [Desulfobacterales bacterium S3730MH5]OEU77420.1 MAG: ribulose-phosphate 3-epimerase [Desulfobacterales bacterium C00003060]OEU80761.1 MAG: ribulose-phosphate 3-epimerase [Desulfobacterales bacterium S5133MH4]